MTVFAYIAAYVLIPLFGLSLASSIDSRSARIGFAFLVGALLLMIEATLFTMIGIRWSIIGLSLPLLIASGVVLWRTTRTDKSVCATPFAIAIIVVAILHLLLSIITTQSINPDYVLFWGTKAVHFAMSRSLDAGYLLSRYAPPRIDYPPLLPIVQAWGLLFSHQIPWITAAAMSAVWLVAAVPVINWLSGSIHATAFWTAAMAASLAFCGSGGNAEAMLVVYISVGAAAIVARRTSIAAIAFAGAMLTKEEALVTIGAILIGVVIYDRGIRRAAIFAASSAAGASVWFAFQKRFGMHVGYDRVTLTHTFHWSNLPTIFREAPKSLAAGCWGLSWLIPLAIIFYIAVRKPRNLRDAIPLLVPVPLLFAFFVYLYLQYESSLAMKMWWILPRLSQPALSLLILAAAFAAGDRMPAHD
ncbi:MAG: hypothetical protein JO093_18650 [Acidobacteria bacterium]|nr:hypothetical protein [Acidobacteriota bacterium]MBV9187643.1 hypothetical protein [Acidobacteriota bacterium]